MTQRIGQAEPIVIPSDDLPGVPLGTDPEGYANPDQQAYDIRLTPLAPVAATRLPTSLPHNPKATYLAILERVQGNAGRAAEEAFAACDWFALFDKTVADRYRKSAKHLAEFRDHVASLIEQEGL